jgi:endoglucanase
MKPQRSPLLNSRPTTWAVLIVTLLVASCQVRQRSKPGVASHPSAVAPIATGGVAPIDRSLPRPDIIAKSAPLPGFMRGINLGNCFDAPSEGAWGTHITERHFEMAAAAGFDHVRLPVRFTTNQRSEASAPFTIKDDFWKRIDWALDQALSRKLSVILDVHHFEEIHKDPNANKERLYALWRQIATRYASRPPQVAFEVLNEPNGELKPELVNEIMARSLAIIRETNPDRIVMIEPYFWASAEHLASLTVPANDPNVVGQFHMYQPILFTHQGAEWMEPWYRTMGVVFPGPPTTPIKPVAAAETQDWVMQFFAMYNNEPAATNPSGPVTVYAHFDLAAKWVKQTGHRIYLGEFGAIRGADEQSRQNYVWLVRTEAERRGMGWAYWDDGGKFAAMNPRNGTWNDGLRRALLE